MKRLSWLRTTPRILGGTAACYWVYESDASDSYCGGECGEGKADYNSPIGIIVKDVPALICEKCGEAYFEEKEARVLEEIGQIAKIKLEAIRVATRT